MKVHIGKKIREVVKKSGFSVTKFAEKVNCSRRNIYSIFHKESIDTGLLTRIGDILEHDFFSYYISEKPNELDLVEERSKETGYYIGKDKTYQEQINVLTKEVEYLTEINDLLKEKLKGSGKN